jgi:hypothetical protein
MHIEVSACGRQAGHQGHRRCQGAYSIDDHEALLLFERLMVRLTSGQCLKFRTDQAQDVKKVEKFNAQFTLALLSVTQA